MSTLDPSVNWDKNKSPPDATVQQNAFLALCAVNNFIAELHSSLATTQKEPQQNLFQR